jgi:hypothetical protein
MQKKQAFEMTLSKELHLSDREWVENGGCHPPIEKSILRNHKKGNRDIKRNTQKFKLSPGGLHRPPSFSFP